MIDIQNRDVKDILDYQISRLKDTLLYAQLHSPFYQQLFKQFEIDPKRIKNAEHFKSIPFTTKDDLQDKNTSFFCMPISEVSEISSTSGTIGKPVFVISSTKDLDRLASNEAMSFNLAGVQKEDLIQLMTTMDKRFMAGLAYYLGSRKLGSGIVRVGSGLPELQWDTILSLKPTVIIVVPSFILKLIEYAEKHGIDYKSTSVTKAICIGEPIRNEKLEPNTLGSKILEKWNIELHSTYASTEMASAFTECEYGIGGHLLPEMVYLEVLDENGHDVEDGQSGEVVITTLGLEAMPLIRYKTGDICHVFRSQCKCGRSTPRLGPIIGRKKHMIKYKGTTLYPPAINNVLNDFQEIKNYLVEVNQSEIGTDDLKVRISVDNQSEKLLEEIKNHFKSKLRVTPKIEYIEADELKKLQMLEKNRKPIKFIDKRGFT